IELRRVRGSELRANPKNWRKHGEAQRKALAGVLAEVGQAGALLAYETPDGLQLIDGHLRAEDYGDAEWPVLILDVDESEADLILATHDPLAALAETDDGLLRGLLDGMGAEAATLAKAAQTETALARLLLPADGLTDPDDVPEAPAVPVTQPGDLILLGEHRLLCGDATDGEAVGELMAGQLATLMNTDPPYGVAYSDEARVAADRAHVRPDRRPKWADGIENDGVDGAKLQAFLEATIRTAVPHLIPNAAYYLWHPMLTQGTFFAAAAAAADILIHRQIIWIKKSMLFGFGDYHWQHELCFYGWRRGYRPSFFGERNQTTYWPITHDTSNLNRVHPTQKPVELFARPINNHTRSGELVYEPFAGSGSQIIAAEQLGRRCYAMEISPAYCDVIINRWEAFTGKKAERQAATAAA
nr:DNA modification methylase [Pirellulales bacterium]